MELYRSFAKLDRIEQVAAAMASLAKRTGRPVRTEFNRHKLVVKPGTTKEHILKLFRTRLRRIDLKAEEVQKKWRNTKAGRIEAHQRRLQRECAKRSVVEGIQKFTPKDLGEWTDYVRNSEKYDGLKSWQLQMLRFISRWMNIMERKMSEGRKLKDIIEESAHEADLEQIDRMCYTGKFVSRFWIHSKEFDRWNTIVD